MRTVCIVGIHKRTGGQWQQQLRGQAMGSPVQSSPVQCSPQGLTGLGWPDVKKIRSEAQSYIRRFLGAAVEPCCLLLPELTAPSRSTGTQPGWGKGSGGSAKGGPAQWPRGGVYARESAWQRPGLWLLASDCWLFAAAEYRMLDASMRFQIFRKLSGVFSMTCRGACEFHGWVGLFWSCADGCNVQ